MTSAVVLAVTFLAMEPVTYATHRWVMHGLGWVLHKSHHRKLATRFEANDLFPLMFSAVAMLLFAVAIQWEPLWPVCWGITAYGAAYLFVHDIFIHERLPLPRKLFAFLEPLRRAHLLHHQFNGEPYGMLIPIVPATLRERAAQREATAAGRTASLRQ
jgi:beta-carotene 3-hydroxylase